MKKVGFIGYRGMVGSVLLDRLTTEANWNNFHSVFFSTSQVGGKAPSVPNLLKENLKNAFDLNELAKLDIIVTTQGSDYTNKVYQKLQDFGWNGFWIDASSALRMNKNATIILDPINQNLITKALQNGCKTFVGGNCTVSLMLLALGGLFQANLIEWISVATYQAASGAGAKHINELLTQMSAVSEIYEKNKNQHILEIEKQIHKQIKTADFPTANFGATLACSLIPWIDTLQSTGQTKEEWKASVETNKILGNKDEVIKIDSTCVRIPALRSHSQAFTIKLKQNLEIDEIKKIIASHNQWVKVIENDKTATLQDLNPVAVSGSLDIVVGRIRKMNLEDNVITAFSSGDQLLWGAAEPIRRMLMQLV